MGADFDLQLWVQRDQPQAGQRFEARLGAAIDKMAESSDRLFMDVAHQRPLLGGEHSLMECRVDHGDGILSLQTTDCLSDRGRNRHQPSMRGSSAPVEDPVG